MTGVLLYTETMLYDLIVIGGGASGLAAAVTAAKRGKKVLILEKEEKVGKKILVTGNGKCNLSNVDMRWEKYDLPEVEDVIKTDVRAFFKELGLMTKEVGGRVYPYSESALSVVSVLRKSFTGETKTGEEVKAIERKGENFVCNGYEGKAVALCTGSNATFGTESCFLLEKFGHTVVKRRPSVVPLVTDTTYIKGLNGLRSKGEISLVKGKEKVKTERGEILFKNNGLSGIASMMLSTFIARKEENFDVSIDFLPDLTEEEVEPYLRINGAESCLIKAVAQAVEKQARDRKESLFAVMKDFRVTNVKTGSVKTAQVLCGGLKTDEFDENFQSKKQKGLYACGEALDVDGECGGYNLHFAFASGIRVGEKC